MSQLKPKIEPSFDPLRLPLLLTKARVALLLDISERSLERWVQEGRFPAPISTGGDKRTIRWRKADVLDWLQSLQPVS